jgi:hypothetical protein
VTHYFERELLASFPGAARQQPSESCSVGHQRIVHASRQPELLLLEFQLDYWEDNLMMCYFEKEHFRDVPHHRPSESSCVGHQRIVRSMRQNELLALLAHHIDYREDKPVVYIFEKEQVSFSQDASHQQHPSKSCSVGRQRIAHP